MELWPLEELHFSGGPGSQSTFCPVACCISRQCARGAALTAAGMRSCSASCSCIITACVQARWVSQIGNIGVRGVPRALMSQWFHCSQTPKGRNIYDTIVFRILLYLFCFCSSGLFHSLVTLSGGLVLLFSIYIIDFCPVLVMYVLSVKFCLYFSNELILIIQLCLFIAIVVNILTKPNLLFFDIWNTWQHNCWKYHSPLSNLCPPRV